MIFEHRTKLKSFNCLLQKVENNKYLKKPFKTQKLFTIFTITLNNNNDCIKSLKNIIDGLNLWWYELCIYQKQMKQKNITPEFYFNIITEIKIYVFLYYTLN